MSKKILIALTVAFALSLLIPKGFCRDAGSAGGYNVTRIAVATLDILKEKGILPESSFKEFSKLLPAKQTDLLSSGSSVIDLYDRLGTFILEKGISSQDDISAAKRLAAEGGGLKIGGYNPVVLFASFLDILVQKDVVSLSEAQHILDESMIGE